MCNRSVDIPIRRAAKSTVTPASGGPAWPVLELSPYSDGVASGVGVGCATKPSRLASINSSAA